MDVRIFPNPRKLSEAVAEFFVRTSQASIQKNGKFTVALAGGTTPERTYLQLATSKFSSRVDWANTHLYWGDERCVPSDHQDSNFQMALNALLKHVPIPEANVHRMEGEIKPSFAASRYERIMQSNLGVSPGLDLVLLGLGTDGHTASLFPGTAALRETKHWVKANYVGKLSGWRITMTPFTINQATNIVFLVSGENKSRVLHQVLQGDFCPNQYPSQLINPCNGNVFFYIDRPAAGRIA